MAELFAPFSKVAAKNPFSSSPVERSVEEIATVTDENRMICDPYPRLLVARDTVNQGAAAVLMSVEAARRLGVPEEKWVYLRGHADQTEQDLLDRVDVSVSYSAKQAVVEALRVAGIGIDEVATFDLYSCFPFPVSNMLNEEMLHKNKIVRLRERRSLQSRRAEACLWCMVDGVLETTG